MVLSIGSAFRTDTTDADDAVSKERSGARLVRRGVF
jgi:hypothetical protein